MKSKILSSLPAWQPLAGPPAPDAVPTPDALPVWSGKSAPPCIGDVVNVSCNAIGEAAVLGYFVEAGFLGLYVRPLDPPAWYVRQNGKDAACGVFGREIEA